MQIYFLAWQKVHCLLWSKVELDSAGEACPELRIV